MYECSKVVDRVVRDFDVSIHVNVVLEPENCAEVSAASNAESEPIRIGIWAVCGHCDALNGVVAKICSASSVIETMLLARVA